MLMERTCVIRSVRIRSPLSRTSLTISEFDKVKLAAGTCVKQGRTTCRKALKQKELPANRHYNTARPFGQAPTAPPGRQTGWGTSVRLAAQQDAPGFAITSIVWQVIGNDVDSHGDRNPSSRSRRAGATGARSRARQAGTRAFSREATLRLDLSSRRNGCVGDDRSPAIDEGTVC